MRLPQMRSGFDRALDRCLEAVRSGATDVEALVQSCPDHAERLRPLLQAAIEMRGSTAPEPQEKRGGLARLQAALVARRERKLATATPGLSRARWARRSGLLVAIGGMSVIAIASGAAAASSHVRKVIVPAPVYDNIWGKDKAHVEGVIRQVDEGQFVLEAQRGQQRNIQFTDKTKILNGRGTPVAGTTLATGQRVNVAGQEDEDLFLAEQVQVEEPENLVAPPPPTSTPVPPTATPTPVPVTFEGRITSIQGSLMTIAGGDDRRWTVTTDAATKFSGKISEGASVRVEGGLRQDGIVLARLIQGPGNQEKDGSENEQSIPRSGPAKRNDDGSDGGERQDRAPAPPAPLFGENSLGRAVESGAAGAPPPSSAKHADRSAPSEKAAAGDHQSGSKNAPSAANKGRPPAGRNTHSAPRTH